jgi:hypothetical protein
MYSPKVLIGDDAHNDGRGTAYVVLGHQLTLPGVVAGHGGE